MPPKIVLKGEDLSGHDFSGQDLRGADLRNAILTGANFNQARLEKVRFDGANLAGARLNFADAWQAHFTDANCDGLHCNGLDVTHAHGFALCAPVLMRPHPAYGNWRQGQVWVACGAALEYQPVETARAYITSSFNRFEGAALLAAITFIEFAILQGQELRTTARDEWARLWYARER